MKKGGGRDRGSQAKDQLGLDQPTGGRHFVTTGDSCSYKEREGGLLLTLGAKSQTGVFCPGPLNLRKQTRVTGCGHWKVLDIIASTSPVIDGESEAQREGFLPDVTQARGGARIRTQGWALQLSDISENRMVPCQH